MPNTAPATAEAVIPGPCVFEAPDTLAESLALLRHHAVAPQPQPTMGEGDTLALKEIEVLPTVFQPRSVEDEESGADASHVADLVRVLERRGERGLDPIAVLWSGQRWFVVDGHHRLAAYREAEGWRGRPVPVEVLTGSLEALMAEAVERNVKTTLSMVKTDKTNAGWRLVCLTELQVKEVAARADISPSQVKKMRSRVRELDDLYPGRFTGEDLAQYRWLVVMQPNFPEIAAKPEIDDGWVAKLAHDFHGRLRKEFGAKLHTNPDAFAMAIRMVHNGLPSMLMQSLDWESELDEALRAREEEATYDFS
jgi:hypothetical protein